MQDSDQSLPIDFIIVASNNIGENAYVAEKRAKYRRAFEGLMQWEGLKLFYETSKDRQIIFVKIHCPFERLAKEAELMRLEMPLKNVKPNL